MTMEETSPSEERKRKRASTPDVQSDTDEDMPLGRSLATHTKQPHTLLKTEDRAAEDTCSTSADTQQTTQMTDGAEAFGGVPVAGVPLQLPISKTSNSPTVKGEPVQSPQTKAPTAAAKTTRKKAVPKRLLRTEADFEPIHVWWDEHKSEGDLSQWQYLEHRGIMFTAPYAPHNVAMKFEGVNVTLPPEAEEVANYWCSVIGTEWSEKAPFRKNFWHAFISKLPKDHVIVAHPESKKDGLQYCDFSPIKEYLDNEKERKKDRTKEEKEVEKNEKNVLEAPYTHALVDWRREKVASVRIEPPQLFRGRGVHPKQGQLKARIFPEEVTINVSNGAGVPRCPDDVPGHCWKDVFHDNTVSWLTYYKDSINNSFKYVFLSAASSLKGRSDFEKYEKARRLKHHIDSVRDSYRSKMKSSDTVDRQLGTATYLIDFLALRAGDTKNTEEEADTVGCCSLRLEHLKFNEDTSELTLDFLGKDSIRYFNTVKIDPLAMKNLQFLSRDKAPEDDIFDCINPSVLNRYLRELMPHLSAKVFRTYNASITLQDELYKVSDSGTDMSNPQAIANFYDACNREVAILCNHQRSVPKQHAASMEKIQAQLDSLDADIAECEEYLAKGGAGRKGRKAGEGSASGSTSKSIIRAGMSDEQVKNKMAQLKKKKSNLTLTQRVKDENKTVALGTAKINYMDPRITVAFSKRSEFPVERVFNKNLRGKFPWAMYAKSDFVF